MKRITNNLFMLLVLVLMCTASVFAQTKMGVVGTVKDNTGAPMVGVSVLEQGTTNGTVTDFDGRYTIHVPQGATIVYSFIGYEAQSIVATESTIDVTLYEETEGIEEIVVVGYGVQKKSSVTGAISQVKKEDMQNRTIVDAGQALQGKTSGVQVVNASSAPGANPQIRVRGYSSNVSSDPLFVVDGVRMKSIGGIDPNDIASMEVLKDAASAAIYGAEAGNGVVLITTKRGGKNDNGSIIYDMQFASQSLGNIPTLLNAKEYIQYQTEAGTLNQEKLDLFYDGKTDTDWMDEVYGNSAMWKHTLSFTGGTQIGNYYVSLSYLNNNGIVKGDKDTYKRLTATINAERKIKDWLKVSTTNQIEKYDLKSVSESSEYGSIITTTMAMDPLTPAVYKGGLAGVPEYIKTIMNTPNTDGVLPTFLKDEDGNYYGISQFYVAEGYNPLISRDNTDSKTGGWRINGSLTADITPFAGFTFTSKFGYRLTGSSNTSVGHPAYGNTRNDARYQSSLSAQTSISRYYQWENYANYMKSIGQNNFTIMAGISFQETVSNYTGGSLQNTAPDGAVKKDSPLFYYLNYASDSAVKSVSGEETESTKYSYFGRLSYDFAGRYMIQASLRADAADLAVLPSTKRWGYFPAVSLGWTISDESFFSGLADKITSLKLRASWGQNGSLGALSGYMYSTDMALSGYYPLIGQNPDGSYNYTVGAKPTSLGNNELKWETSEQINFGLDGRALNDRLTFGIDYYVKKTIDLLVSGTVPSYCIGGTTSPVNAGDVENKGFEFELGWRDQIGDFNYGVRGNLATLKNEVTYLDPSLPRIDGTYFHNQPVTVFEKGFPVYHFYGYKFAGIDEADGESLFYNAQGEKTKAPTADDKTDLGSAIPTVNYGVTLTAAWKGIDLTVFGTGAAGNKIFNLMNRSDYITSNKLKELLYDDRWTPTHTKASAPKPGSNNFDTYVRSDAMVFDGSYFKIKQIQLGYSLPKDLLSKASIKRARVYVSLDDFFTFTDYKGMDPESCATGISGMGIDKGAYPTSKKVVFGLNLEL
ncbi:MAG: TonB-dependent receptor [Bacteroidia bacterium]|nr:TonB-dependent receptor [Bacteroidia bacterium]